jgi:glycosyltransferase involved in cell wall biosynthesis
MKILFVTPYSPANPVFGGALRIYHVLAQLCANHDVTIAGFSTAAEERSLIGQFPSLTVKAHFVDYHYSNSSLRWRMIRSLFSFHSNWYHLTRSETLQNKLDELLAAQTFDLILCEFPVMAMYSYKSNAIKITDCHNVEYDNFKRMSKVGNMFKKLFYFLEARKFFKEEIKVFDQQDALFVTSKRDIELINQTNETISKYLIPNGVDTDFYKPVQSCTIPFSMIFIGMMKYVPNYDGIEFFLDEIFPIILKKIPQATITIVGKNPPGCITSRRSQNTIITGFVQDTRPFIEEATVYVVPLRMGGGTRLKILEALAVKKPLVTTSVGCEGIDVVDRKEVMIADHPAEFAARVIELFEYPERGIILAENGYALVMNQYRWDQIGKRIELAIQELYSRKRDPKVETGFTKYDAAAFKDSKMNVYNQHLKGLTCLQQ